MAVDISENENFIPDKYKQKGNYENDPKTIVL